MMRATPRSNAGDGRVDLTLESYLALLSDVPAVGADCFEPERMCVVAGYMHKLWSQIWI